MASADTELAVCRREVAFGRTELEVAEARAREASAQQQREVSDLRAQVRDLSARVSTAYLRGSEDGVATQRALDTARQELGEMCSEVLMAQAEAELAEAVHGGARGEWREASEIKARREAAERRSAELEEEQAALEALLPELRQDAHAGEEACEVQRREVRDLEATLKDRERSVISYDVRARELHRDLRHVLEELRASYEASQQEKQRLVAHIARLERARSPRAAAAMRVLHHAPQLQREAPDAEPPGQQPWWALRERTLAVTATSPPAASPPRRHPAEVIEQPAAAPPPRRQAPRMAPAPLPPRAAVRDAARDARERQETAERWQASAAPRRSRAVDERFSVARSPLEEEALELHAVPAPRSSVAAALLERAESEGAEEDPEPRWSICSGRSHQASPPASESRGSFRKRSSAPLETSFRGAPPTDLDETGEVGSDTMSYWMDYSVSQEARAGDEEVLSSRGPK